MKQALAEHFPANVEIWEAGGGLYFWARLPEHISTGVKSKVFQAALKNDVLYVSRRTLLRRRSGARQAGPRNAHQFRQRERGEHP